MLRSAKNAHAQTNDSTLILVHNYFFFTPYKSRIPIPALVPTTFVYGIWLFQDAPYDLETSQRSGHALMTPANAIWWAFVRVSSSRYRVMG